MTRGRTKQLLGILILLGIPQLLFSQTAGPAVPAPQKTNDDSARLFDYKTSNSFDLKEVATREQNGVTIRDVNYAAYNPRHGRIKAYLIKPEGSGPFAGALFFHWLGNSKSDRTQFLDEAVALARQGTVSLLIQGFFPWLEAPTEGQADRQQVIDQTIEVRRALDLLLSQSGVDSKRIGYVGHDYGAMYGAIVAGLDKRVKSYVFIAGMGNFSDWSLKYWPVTAAKGKEAYEQAMKSVDPIDFVSRAAPAQLLFQFANTDKFISKMTATAFYEAASPPKQIKWYDAMHDLNVEAARSDRRDWLSRELGLANLRLKVPNDPAGSVRPYLLAISVADLDETVKWYEEKLGFVVKERFDFPKHKMRIALLELNKFQLELVEDKKSLSLQAIQKQFPEVADQTRFQTYVKFAFTVRDIESLAKQLKDKRAAFHMDLTDSNRMPGGKFFIIKDNSGNWLQFFQIAN